MNAPAPICALDIESDGLHPARQAWEVALIRRDDTGTREEHFFLPLDLSTADPAGLRIGRFYERHPEGLRLARGLPVKTGAVKDPLAAARLIARMTHDATIVGATPNFDVEVLDRLLRRHQIVPAWRYRLRCVTTLTSGHLRRDVGGLAACADALGITPEAAHEALADARTALRIHDTVMGITRATRPPRDPNAKRREVYDPAADGYETRSFDAGWERGVADVVEWIRDERPRVSDVAADIDSTFLAEVDEAPS